MKLLNESDLLNIEFRKQVIDEINGHENYARKESDLKKYEIYKDMTRKWVIDAIAKEFSQETVAQMQNRASNISICRKIVNKLSQCYLNGVERNVESDQEKIDILSKEMDINSKMKQIDRIVQLHKNAIAQVIPEFNYKSGKYDIAIRPLRPHQYDVIEDYRNHEVPRVVILTDFVAHNHSGDGVSQKIADSPADPDSKNFIWWSDLYHFTTDDKGQILSGLSPEGLVNPIGELPFVNFAEGQDGEFWARGGSDLIDGSILINVLLTDMFGIANVQGWGQLVITGKNLPKVIQGGPHRAILIDQDVGDPNPSVEFKNANAPLDVWMQMIEQYTALLLSSNNLSPSNVAGKLDSTQFPSGIAMMIEQAESTADVQDSQRLFKDKEPLVWELVKKWFDLYFSLNSLTDRFQVVGSFNDSNVQLKFNNPKPVISEKEKLEAIQLRKELGISTLVDLIKQDNPDMSEQEAEEKLKEILEEKMMAVKKQMVEHDPQFIDGEMEALPNKLKSLPKEFDEEVDSL